MVNNVELIGVTEYLTLQKGYNTCINQCRYNRVRLDSFHHIMIRGFRGKQEVPSQQYKLPSRANDRLCGLVVRVSGYRYRGPGFDLVLVLAERTPSHSKQNLDIFLTVTAALTRKSVGF
jgi:hypothetical protein